MKSELNHRLTACTLAGEIAALEEQERVLLMGLAAVRIEKAQKREAYAAADAAADAARGTIRRRRPVRRPVFSQV